MESKTKGSWIVHHMNKLRQMTATGEFDRIHTAGKLGLLLSSISASNQSQLTHSQVDAVATAAGINELETTSLLSRLAQRKLISRSSAGIEILGVTSSAVLTHTAAIFDEASPSPAEQAALELSEQASVAPLDTKRATQYVRDIFKLSAIDAVELVAASEDIGFVDAAEIDSSTKLLFNGNIFRRDSARKIQDVLTSLSQDEHQRVLQFETHLKQNGCATIDEAHEVLGENLFAKLQSISMFDVSEVSNEVEQVRYVTRPAAFSKFGDPLTEDAMDLAKAFVSCLKYGMTRRDPSRGKIHMLRALMAKLIRGEWTNAATAIGQDYKVLEMKRVIELRHSRGDMYEMKLLKRDVGELALQVLQEGDASDNSLPNFPSAPVSKYRPPEENRKRTRRRLNEVSRKQSDRLLLTIRTGGVVK